MPAARGSAWAAVFMTAALPFGQSGAFAQTPVIGAGLRITAVAELPRQAWDIPLDGIVTEQALYPGPNGHLLE